MKTPLYVGAADTIINYRKRKYASPFEQINKKKNENFSAFFTFSRARSEQRPGPGQEAQEKVPQEAGGGF